MAKSPEKFTLPSLGGTLGFGEPLTIFFCTACQKELASVHGRSRLGPLLRAIYATWHVRETSVVC